jgi:hypothetical protein
MPWVGFETTIPAWERVKTVHALDGAAAVIGQVTMLGIIIWATHFTSKTSLSETLGPHDDDDSVRLAISTYITRGYIM